MDCTRCRLGFAAAVFLVGALSDDPVRGQGLTVDTGGHAALNGKSVFASWNFHAGEDITEDYDRYAEFLPFLHGWDFRINLPHVQFQLARAGGSASPPAMVGVEEGGDLATYGHVNNSIWLFQMDSQEGIIYAKVIPSRRDLDGSTTQNVTSLVADWFPVSVSVGEGGPVEKPAVAVIGKGLGVARIYIVARDRQGALHMTSHTVTGLEGRGPPVIVAGLLGPGIGLDSGWDEPWIPLGISSDSRPVLTAAFDGKLALAYLQGGLQVQVYTPSTDTWGPPAVVETLAGSPQLIWDGTALNVFFISFGTPLVHHAYALTDNPLEFYAVRPVSSLVAVRFSLFHAMFFNRRLHVVIRQDNSEESGPVFYTTSTTDPGRPSEWSIPSDTGITTITQPRVASLYENIFVMGADFDGRVRYARKDPNRPGNDLTGAAFADHWLEPGQDIDPTAPGNFSGLETLTWNSDLYLAAEMGGTTVMPVGTYIVNFGRAALKQLITQKWGMSLLWGEPGGSRLMRPAEFASAGEIPALADIDGDGDSDLVKFSHAESLGPVYLYRNNGGEIMPREVWSQAFSLAGEIPAVGDFDGDGRDDMITFAQKLQTAIGGAIIGHAPVWVLPTSSLHTGPQVWHREFSPLGEIPMVGDFNGDGNDDIISFTQKVITDFDGGLIGQAVVLVALSDGTKFGPSELWHRYFSEPGEIPMVGDFNGDGLDDIVTFTQKQQFNGDGSLLGHAPVWVALSEGTRFGPSSVWHTYFSEQGEVPQVADLNMDGRDDIITFLADKSDAGTAARNVYVAFSVGNRFERSTVWHSDFVRSNQVRLGPGKRVYSPRIGHIGTSAGARTLGTWTGLSEDLDKPVPDIFAFSPDGSVQTARTMGNVPYPSGAPWERYKFFTDKGIGVALFPEWIFEGPGHCIAGDHRFALNGLGGVGGGNLTVSSVRFGGRAPHILEELGHSLFANCFRPASDPFGLVASIFEVPPEQGGVGSNAMPGCPDTGGFYSCRPDAPEEHYFLQLLSRYRLNPEQFRERIAQETDPAAQTRLNAQYQWFKQNWFDGLEFATGPSMNASLEQPGVPLLAAALPPIIPDPATESGESAADCGAGCGAGLPLLAPMAMLFWLMKIRYRRRNP